MHKKLGEDKGKNVSEKHGQTLANRTNPGPSFQLYQRPFVHYTLMLLCSKTA
jgi:hypothetical protein